MVTSATWSAARKRLIANRYRVVSCLQLFLVSSKRAWLVNCLKGCCGAPLLQYGLVVNKVHALCRRIYFISWTFLLNLSKPYARERRIPIQPPPCWPTVYSTQYLFCAGDCFELNIQAEGCIVVCSNIHANALKNPTSSAQVSLTDGVTRVLRIPEKSGRPFSSAIQ